MPSAFSRFVVGGSHAIGGSLAGVMSASRSDADRFAGAIVPIRRIWRSDLPQNAHPSTVLRVTECRVGVHGTMGLRHRARQVGSMMRLNRLANPSTVASCHQNENPMSIQKCHCERNLLTKAHLRMH
jgi:hypothetical protein